MRLPIHPAVSIFLISMFPMTAGASWTEGEATILTLDEVLPRVGALLGGSARTTVPGDTPVLLPAGSDIESPKAIQIALAQSGFVLGFSAGGWTIAGASSNGEAVRARTRLRPVASLAPRPMESDVIQSGGLVLFGEVVEPPYRVEIVGEAIEINGVAVFPVPGADVSPPEPTTTQIDTHDRMDAAARNYERNAGTLGSAEAKRILIGELSRLPRVTGAEWLDEETVRLIRPAGDGEIITFARVGREADPPTAEALRAALETEAQLLSRALAENATVFCGATYLLTDSALDAGTLRRRIEEILHSDEPDLLKIARLQVYTGHRDAAADLLFARAR